MGSKVRGRRSRQRVARGAKKEAEVKKRSISDVWRYAIQKELARCGVEDSLDASEVNSIIRRKLAELLDELERFKKRRKSGRV